MKKTLLSLVAIPLIAIGSLTYADCIYETGGNCLIVHDTAARTITVYDTGLTYRITIQVTNLGTTILGTGAQSFGKYYKWGINSPYNGGANSTYESSDNAWGGGNDNQTTDSTIVKGYDTVRHTATNTGGRQGPCPVDYHVPSAGERNELVKLRCGARSDICSGNVIQTPDWWCENNECNWLIYLSGSGIGRAFSNDLLLPIAGTRFYDNGTVNGATVDGNGGYAYYWSSSPRGESYPDRAGDLYIIPNAVYSTNYLQRAYGQSVRCFKNVYIEPSVMNTVTFNANGGDSVTTGSIEVESGDTLDLSLYTGTKEGWDFVGWNTNSGAHEAISTNYNAYPITENITLYAIFKKEGTTLTGTIIQNGATVTPIETGCNIPTIYNNESVVTECTLTFPTATRTNGTVYGYSTDNIETDNPTIINGGTYNISANTTFYVISKSDDIILHVNYLSGVGVQSIGNDSGSCTLTGTWNSTEQATSCTVTAPSITLKPGYGTGKWSSGSIEVLSGNDITLTGDDTYTASATPNDNTQYTVQHYFENVDGTGFDIDNTLTDNLAGTTDTHTGAEYKVVTGFTGSATTSGAESSGDIAGDGSLTLKLYYTRNNHKITYVWSGETPAGAEGFSGDIEGVKYGSSVIIKEPATASGYSFEWTGESTLGITSNSFTMPDDDVVLTGIWTAGEVGYTVEHYFENIDGTGFDIDDSLTDNLIGTTDTHTGAEYKIVTGFTGSSATSGAESSGDIAGDGSLTLKLYYTRDNYTLTFDSNGGSTVNPITAKYQSGIVLPESKRTGYTFTGWKDENDAKFYSGDIYTLSGNTTLTGQWIAETYIVTFDVNSGNALTPNTGAVTYGVVYGTLPTPTRDGYSFNGWFTAATNGTKITSGTIVSVAGNHTLYAQWTQNQPSGGSTGGGSSGGGGGGGSTKTTITTTTGTVTTGTNETNVKTDNQTNLEGKNNQNNGDKGENQKYSDEMQRAYEFAYKHGITTMDSIEKADMEGPLTRIAMAKMLSYYAINVLGQKPDTSRKINFKDVSAALDKKYDNGVTLAYQLGIMGINMKNNKFRPKDYVTRAEFATALSRMLFGIADGKDKYYSTHLAKLMEEGIITNDNPKMRELRGYVMIMLMRSAENK